MNFQFNLFLLLIFRLYVNYRFMRGIEQQFLALQKGFNELIPQHLLKSFDEKELEVWYSHLFPPLYCIDKKKSVMLVNLHFLFEIFINLNIIKITNFVFQNAHAVSDSTPYVFPLNLSIVSIAMKFENALHF